MLEKNGHQVIIFDNGKLALEYLKENGNKEIDMVLMDIQMPEIDGPTATKHIRELEKERDLLMTPIVALTANAMPHHREEYLGCGMNEYLTKPINPEKLFAMLDYVYDRFSDMREKV